MRVRYVTHCDAYNIIIMHVCEYVEGGIEKC